MANKMSEASKRYAGRFAAGMTLYVIVLIVAVWWLNNAPPAGAMRYVLAIAPALPILGVIASMGLYLVEEKDEFGRMLLAQAMLCGLGFILALATVWGFLEELGGAPRFPLYMIFPIFCAGMGISYPILRARYGGGLS